MGSGTRGLFLQIGGNVDNLAVAAKAGKSIMADLSTGTVAKIEDIQEAFRKLGGGAAEESARSLQQTYSRTFAAIRANAQSVLDAPNASAALGIVNVTAANDAAGASERQAAGLRLVAEAAARASAAQNDDNAELRIFATTAAAAAVGAEQQAVALRAQASALGLVHGELIANGEGAEVVVAGHNRMSTSGLILEHVARSIGDSFAAGMPPGQIFAEQLGRIGEAATLVASGVEGGGKLGAIAGFLTGGWGIALTLGVSLAAPLIGELIKMGSASDEVGEKLRKQAAESEASATASAEFAKTADGVAKAIRDENEALGKNIDSEVSATDKTLAHVRALRDQEIQIRKVVVALAEHAAAQFNVAQSQTFGAAGGAGAGIATSIYANQSAQAKAAVVEANKNLAEAQNAVREAEIHSGVEEAKAAADPLTRINQQYERMADKAKDAARGNDKLAVSIGHTLSVIEEQRAAALKAEREREEAQRRAARDDRPFGRQVTVAEATQIVGTIGGRVTSGYRSREDQERIYADKLAGHHDGPVAKPGFSDHERGQAIDVAFGPGISIASIKEAFQAAGVALKQVTPEPGQHVFHVGFSQKGGDPEAAARRQQAAEHRKVVSGANDDRAYQGDTRQADDDILSAGAELANTTKARAAIAIERLRSDLVARSAAIQDEVIAGKLTQPQADILKDKLSSAEYEHEQLTQRKLQSETIKRQAEQEQVRLDGDAALLQLEGALAITTKQRRDIALKLLAIDEQRQRAAQDAIINDPTSTPEQIEDAKARRKQVDDQHPLQVQQIDRQNASPLTDYRNQLQKNVGDVHDALSGVAVDGFKNIEDGFTGVISGTETVAGAFKKMASSIISDIARIVIERAILGAIGGGAAGGGAAAGGGFLSKIFKFADGGHIKGPGTGRSDSMVARVSNGEFIVNAAATARHLPLLHALNDNSIPAFADGGVVGHIPYMRDLSPEEVSQVSAASQPTIIVKTEEGALFRPVVASISGGQVQQAAPRIASAGATLAGQADATRRRRTIPS